MALRFTCLQALHVAETPSDLTGFPGYEAERYAVRGACLGRTMLVQRFDARRADANPLGTVWTLTEEQRN